jgi:hypothetical protein
VVWIFLSAGVLTRRNHFSSPAAYKLLHVVTIFVEATLDADAS